MVIQNMETGECEPIDWCYECFFTEGYTYKAPQGIDASEEKDLGELLKIMERNLIEDMR